MVSIGFVLKDLTQSLSEEVESYLKYVSSHTKKEILKKDKDRILEIIDQNNRVSSVIDSEEFKELTRLQKEQISPVTLGLIYCIDGRISGILLGGRFASHWEVPAGELAVNKRLSDGSSIPESNELCEALRKMAASENELLEIVMGHTSLSHPDHGCGAMAAKKKSGELPENCNPEDENLKIIEEKTIPALTTIYNEFRKHAGKEEVKRIAIPALYDTDTLGMVFNYDLREEGKALFVSDLTKENASLMEKVFSQQGFFKDKFDNLDYLTQLSTVMLEVRKGLSEKEEFKDLRSKIEDFISQNLMDLSQNQQRVLEIFILRNISLQYLTESFKGGEDHAFSKHNEDYMAVSTRGMIIGKFDPESQLFGSTPSDSASAISFIKTKISIMHATEHDKESFLLFICNPVNSKDLETEDIQLHKVMDANAELFRAIVADPELGNLVLEGKMIPVSVLIEENSRAVVKVIDHSIYI